MDAQSIGALVGTVGVPAAMCLWFMAKTDKRIEANTAASVKQAEGFDQMTAAAEKQTAALHKLTEATERQTTAFERMAQAFDRLRDSCRR